MEGTPEIQDLARRLTFVVDDHSTWAMLFNTEALTLGLGHFRTDEWPTDVDDIAATELEPMLSAKTQDSSSAIVWLEGALAYVRIKAGAAKVAVAASDPLNRDTALDEVRRLVRPRPRPPAGPGVPFVIWRCSRYESGEYEERMLSAPSWAEIAANYVDATRDAIEKLTRLGAPGNEHGGAVIWHGVPGTGKTYALRALARAWREWCDIHVVVDAEAMLSTPAYLDDVLDHRAAGDRWRLVALEDTGELLTSDARERAGQGLARLLNATDGILGQDTRALILITTNEPLGRLHPAVSRPGRCLAEVDFLPLPTDQANAWLAERCEARTDRSLTLAEVFELSTDEPRIRRSPERPTIGFTAPLERAPRATG